MVPTGTQYRIGRGDERATITEVGGAVREYGQGHHEGAREIFQSYPERDVSWAFHGSVLLPWPNRVRDGRYMFDGVEQQLALTEPLRRNAIHGLVAWQQWSLLEHGVAHVALNCRTYPSPGYPFQLDTVVRYELVEAGLTVTTTSLNAGDTACPYAIGFHPYVSTGAGVALDDCTLQIPASRRLLLDERLNPVGSEAVEGTESDFRAPRSLRGRFLDDCFTGVLPDSSGLSWVHLASPDGHVVDVWADSSFGFWQVYSGDALPEPLARRSLAVEPMTAAPNAFQSGDGLLRLEPGDSVTTQWGAKLRQA
ncbi:MAG TPA: aldose 1-epimerase family protein [Acidothermaceae bacterium]